MSESSDPSSSWLRRAMFALNLLFAAGLIALVTLAPLLGTGASKPAGWEKTAWVFANVPAVRRTAIASAIGLTVTAFVFFRSTSSKRTVTTNSPRDPPRSSNVVGA